MSNAITPSLRASLERLKHAGAINGICLAWRRQILVNLMPYEDFRVEQVIQAVNEAHQHFRSSGARDINSVWIGFLDVHALAVFEDELSVIVLHTRAEESDFITTMLRTYLNDAQLLVAAALSPSDTNAADATGSWIPQSQHINPDQTNVLL
ncbi:hypothetical protein BH11VER1_BH11VER1_19670 [soil metagenome]